MTKKDYIKIAKSIKDNTGDDYYDEGHMVYKDGIIQDLCAVFLEDNPNFDKDKFIKACYGE